MDRLFDAQKEMVSVEIAGDALEAYIILHFLPGESNGINRSDLVNIIKSALKRANVNHGIIEEVLNEELPVNTPILIAKGQPPVHGMDSEIKMYKVPEPKPRIIDNGKVNHYDLNLIHHVKTGDWLGERTDPVPGIPGIDVHGNKVGPEEGILYPLLFDHNSVVQVRLEGKDVLYSLKNGAVHYVGDSIAVYDVMEIQGDVDFNTGNIDFDGYVNIEGTVEDNFSVRATKDIEISGVYGIGGVSLIESTEGNVYIRGGVVGKNKAKIICNKNLYVKFLADTEVICEGTVYIGFYARNTRIRAKQVIVESDRGQIIGGIIDADVRVDCAEVGNRMENRTLINIRGFNRVNMQKKMDVIASTIEKKNEEITNLKRKLKSYNTNTQKNNPAAIKIQQEICHINDEIKSLETKYSSIAGYLKTPGQGALVVRKRIYPKVRVAIRKEIFEVFEESIAPTYILKEGKVQVL